MGELVSVRHAQTFLCFSCLRAPPVGPDRFGRVMANVRAAGLSDVDGPSEFPSYKVRAGLGQSVVLD